MLRGLRAEVEIGPALTVKAWSLRSMSGAAENLARAPSEAPRLETEPTRGYQPELDGLRALAVLAVLIVHTIPPSHWIAQVQWGQFGVYLFFVLSGFLITGILLDGRSDSGASGNALVPFYARRALRIFPVYYLTVAVLAACGDQAILHNLRWHLTYTSNVERAVRFVHPGAVDHFWSLCVEEQFYLLWPMAILYLPRRVLEPFVAGVIALGFGYEVAGALGGLSYAQINLQLPGCVAPLAIGGLLALHDRTPGRVALRSHLVRWGLGAALGTLMLLPLVWPSIPGSQSAAGGLCYFATSGFVFAWGCAAVIAGVTPARGAWQQPARALASWPLRSLGRISYAMYVFHYPLLIAIKMRPGHPGLGIPAGPLFLLIVGAGTVALATLSWHFVEAPLNRLKRYVPYPRSAVR